MLLELFCLLNSVCLYRCSPLLAGICYPSIYLHASFYFTLVVFCVCLSLFVIFLYGCCCFSFFRFLILSSSLIAEHYCEYYLQLALQLRTPLLIVHDESLCAILNPCLNFSVRVALNLFTSLSPLFHIVLYSKSTCHQYW